MVKKSKGDWAKARSWFDANPQGSRDQCEQATGANRTAIAQVYHYLHKGRKAKQRRARVKASAKPITPLNAELNGLSIAVEYVKTAGGIAEARRTLDLIDAIRSL